MSWRWNWNAVWIAGAISLLAVGALDAPLGIRLAVYPLMIVILGFVEGARAREADEGGAG